MEILEKAAGAAGQLLRVETRFEGPAGDELAGLLLTFDVGRVLLRADAASGSLVEQYFKAGDSQPADWVIADAEEPWWRVLGSPLSRVFELDPGSDAVGVVLQFRQDDDNPRRIAVMARDGRLVVQLQPPST